MTSVSKTTDDLAMEVMELLLKKHIKLNVTTAGREWSCTFNARDNAQAKYGGAARSAKKNPLKASQELDV